jgi:hypothetical protein
MKLLSPEGISSRDVPTGNLLWVDQVNGNDSLAVRGQKAVPFKTLTAAKIAAQSGDAIIVLPGTYNEYNLLKDGVNWHFFPGAIVDYYGSEGHAIFDTSANGSNETVSAEIAGSGAFRARGGACIVNSWAPDSDLRIHARSMIADANACVKSESSGSNLQIDVADIIQGVPAILKLNPSYCSIRAERLLGILDDCIVCSAGTLFVAARYIYAWYSGVRVIPGGSGSIAVQANEIHSDSDAAVVYEPVPPAVLPALLVREAQISTYSSDTIRISAGGSNRVSLMNCVAYPGGTYSVFSENSTDTLFVQILGTFGESKGWGAAIGGNIKEVGGLRYNV